jgi:hypothetical protein
MRVDKINPKDTYYFLLNIHYSKRIPSISYAFGLFDNDELIGVITYGTPPSSALRKGLAGETNIKRVLELNRLCLKYNRPNEASFLIGRSLRLLPHDLFIVSYADISQNHIGTVYKATNFRYFGLSAKRTDWVIEGQEHLHGITIADKMRGVTNRAQVLRDTYGDKFKLVPRSRKHRFIYVTGTHKEKYYKQILYKQVHI